jgi:hypothetical protein
MSCLSIFFLLPSLAPLSCFCCCCCFFNSGPARTEGSLNGSSLAPNGFSVQSDMASRNLLKKWGGGSGESIRAGRQAGAGAARMWPCAAEAACTRHVQCGFRLMQDPRPHPQAPAPQARKPATSCMPSHPGCTSRTPTRSFLVVGRRARGSATDALSAKLPLPSSSPGLISPNSSHTPITPQTQGAGGGRATHHTEEVNSRLNGTNGEKRTIKKKKKEEKKEKEKRKKEKEKKTLDEDATCYITYF